MRSSAILAFSSLCVMVLAAAATKVWAQAEEESWADTTFEELIPDRPTYTTADELREACEPFVKPIERGHERQMQFDGFWLFIVPYLDSENVELRDAAADILAQMMKVRRHIRASAFKQYVSRDYPINVRVVALAHSLYCHRGRGETASYQEIRAEMEAAWTETLNDIAESPVTPPHFDVLAFALSFRRDCTALIERDNQPIMIRRLLALASSGGREDQRVAMELFWRFPTTLAVDEIVAWYRVQTDPAVRSMWAARIASGSRTLTKIHGRPESDKKLRTLMRFLELAAQDPDADIAKTAKQALEKANAFLGTPEDLQDTSRE